MSQAASRNATRPAITLLTDFGTGDYFVGAMKGVILSINPNASIVDLTHEIPPQDIEAAAFTLLAAYRSFPPATIHVAVVDPGVGSSRRALAIEARDHFFVGPDNGIFSYICEREPGCRAYSLTNTDYFRKPISPTFHGRDVFAPVAAALSAGQQIEKLGTEIKDWMRLDSLAPAKQKRGRIEARIIHIDRFGNCITNLTEKDLSPQMITAGAEIKIKGTSITSFRKFFAEENGPKQDLFAIWGSAGFLEIASQNRSAAHIIGAKRGDSLVVLVKT